jgi:FKBP-type peptidyl-prolyl cis-trans isomerase
MFARRNLIIIAVLLVLAGSYYFLTQKRTNMDSNDQQLDSVATVTPTPTQAGEATTSGNVQTLEGGLKIEDLKVGTGEEVKSGDTVSMHYRGTLENGEKFDSSYDRGQPFQTKIGVGQVIEGWDKGVPGMKVGGKRKLIIPPALGYGASGVPGAIPGNATLIFEVELVEIVK